MTKFEKPGRRKGFDYQDFAKEAGVKALMDANLRFDAVEFASVGLVSAFSSLQLLRPLRLAFCSLFV
jgi:hypothetical protein